ncbi:cross-pathway control 1 [Drepanopeziza brunnea f. sp. 'multigermtubi' MB_m1]|uniref:Cross-pathway control 1 n=1 Tax=Marssonina brunnea f. sp. multigermtubi (strain MB_m1) TaxID=1072389 RepID=K1XTG7_MARBU|nr:cross-pathway control 1 [Drepanopeziza brunnea f. sp. 'multigermtubi' MB_m1]EKD15849.1 cross-pathway control 1 [Drepanopeziza brunnea f. sp. 'multigermtubi' MB_m1]
MTFSFSPKSPSSYPQTYNHNNLNFNPRNHNNQNPTNNLRIATHVHHVLNPVVPTTPVPSVTISSQLTNQYPTSTIFPSPENLSFHVASSFAIPDDFNNSPATTDSNPRWLPSSSSSLPAQSSQQPQYQDLSHREPSPQSQHQDFVLFGSSPSVRSTPSLFNTQATQDQYRRHSAHLNSAQSSQNQRVTAIIQATGHSITPSVLTNRFNLPAQSPHQFYASSASPSAATLQRQQPQQTRPQVPLFSQSTGNIQQAPNMVMQGIFTHPLPANAGDSHIHADMDLFEQFTAFTGEAMTQGSFPSAHSSPAVPTTYDPQMNLSSSSSTNMDTISPSDLHRDTFGTAPNSSAFTNLTTPESQYYQSPDFGQVDAPPYDDRSVTGDAWFPLFPQDKKAEKQQTQVSESPLLPEEELEVSEVLRHRRSATASTQPSAGIRKRDKPLAPIVVEDPHDPVAVKRARNTLAARKSRQRKMERYVELEDEIEKLKAERDHWKGMALSRNIPSGVHQTNVAEFSKCTTVTAFSLIPICLVVVAAINKPIVTSSRMFPIFMPYVITMKHFQQNTSSPSLLVKSRCKYPHSDLQLNTQSAETLTEKSSIP